MMTLLYYDFINLVNWLFCNLLIRNSLRKRNVIKLMASSTSLIFQGASPVWVQLHTMPGSWKTGTSWLCPWRTWSLTYEWYYEIAVCSFAGTYNFKFGVPKFSMEILAKFHEKIPNRSGVIRYFRSWKHSSPPFYERSYMQSSYITYCN